MAELRLRTNHKTIQFLGTLVIASIGGFIFNLIGLPIPWLLGSMTAILITSHFRSVQFLTWPRWFRDTGLIIVGYSIGLSFTQSSLLQMIGKLPSMLLITLTITIIAAIGAYLVSRLSGVDYPTVLTGSIPGGLTQMIIFAEEVKGIDITTVTFFQVTRMLMIVIFVPLLIFSPLFPMGESPVTSGTLLNEASLKDFPVQLLILFLILSFIFAKIAKKLKLPTAYLVGPILGTAILNILGFGGPAVPSSLLDLSQLMIGGYIGLLLKPERLQNKAKIIPLALLNGLVMVCASFALSFIFVHFYQFSLATSFLSLAPGGMEQMGIIAHEVNADLSMVTGYQLFRLFFIYFAVPPILKWVLLQNNRRKQKRDTGSGSLSHADSKRG
ncbi:membrane protein AbrB duplication [Schinkia azotoformans MEV2011]|uniref:Membrane protein AbrB duplication n=1 Tax=Schinkia azotoformans MEV2011 TaxID=1348973 RepID=A0A072NJI1_SCHAZ|nr:AbrB family transcriptional regulator [Schinkia azotoformans]KEF37864.1 membrane protein AbrB duplication [Schinkia azotoformans MEV2011]MEC1696546.1 AbrB family transcriptional regulator [Schinkia azotoformans]MEC1725963.1 AbrB family transcriptional regulator [Schinkia azotoformans]MEC1770090.1 AbrB family transcriptional regulator [Schinkia azotoformans]MEC1778766.1 AbrB family transcriptional regulator [Schinkia azotoformans]